MEQPVHTLTHLQLRRAAMDLSKLAVAWAEREEGVPPIKRHDPGAIGAAEGQVPAWRDGAGIGELQHRVLDVADDLVVLFQQLLQLLNAVLQHRDLALLRTTREGTNKDHHKNNQISRRHDDSPCHFLHS